MTDGTEHRGESAAPTHNPALPQQEQGADPTQPAAAPHQGAPAAPGGYGYPQVPEVPSTPSGYGYPQGGNPYAQPASGYPQPGPQPTPPQMPQQSAFPQPAFPQQPQPPQPQPQSQSPFTSQPQQPFGSGPDGPNWEQLADLAETQSRRKRRLWTTGIVVTACLLGIGAGTLFIGFGKDKGPDKPQASGTATASASTKPTAGSSKVPSNTPTVPGQPNLLADHSGQANVAIGPDAQVNAVTDGYVLRFKADSNSFAQSASPVVDVTKSFSISAWVENEAADGPRIALSQGDGVSYSFELGRDDAGGKKSWVFRVQTADGGNDSNAVQAVAESTTTVGQWALLTGVYDATQRNITLYVNGQPAQSTPLPNGSIWSGPGPMQFGRSREHNQWGSMWAGVVGHILVWNQALTAPQVTDLKNGGTGQSAKPMASWLIG
ncbi:LamG domain-containing protein [Kitasatospora azatica]|uniref:LamG domain-containing protein n=1 Tax=Kitasatospora azatica TaxID=58347 RepID=UPI0005678983|nr:LamG domain-containing protein [Kitasatospora azatica]